MKMDKLKLLWCRLFHKWDKVAHEDGHKYVCHKCKEWRGNVYK